MKIADIQITIKANQYQLISSLCSPFLISWYVIFSRQQEKNTEKAKTGPQKYDEHLGQEESICVSVRTKMLGGLNTVKPDSCLYLLSEFWDI